MQRHSRALRVDLADALGAARRWLAVGQRQLGLVPSQNSTGGKASLGRITKRGDDYLRTLLIQGARSAVMSAGKRTDRISQWLVQLKERAAWQKAAVALANKNAHILWAVLARDAVFDPNHVPELPAARRSPKVQQAAPA